MLVSRDSEGYLFQPSDWDEDVARYQYLTPGQSLDRRLAASVISYS